MREKKVMNNGSNRMVGGKRIKFGVQVNARGFDPDPCAGRVQDFDIRMNLSNRNGERRPSVDYRMLAEEDDLAGRGGDCQVTLRNRIQPLP